jgi:hypothetical protein
MKNLCEKVGGERRNLTRLEDHGATGRKRRRYLADNLVHRPVPGCDKTADADRLLSQEGRTLKLFKLEAPQHVHHLGQVP